MAAASNVRILYFNNEIQAAAAALNKVNVMHIPVIHSVHKCCILPVKSEKGKSKSPSRSHSKTSKKSKKTKSAVVPVDILSPAAMLNVYYISHNASDCLRFRGFGWAGGPKKKKGKGKKT